MALVLQCLAIGLLIFAYLNDDDDDDDDGIYAGTWMTVSCND